MADATQTDVNAQNADAASAKDKPKVWSDDEVQKIIRERQEAKERLRKIDEDTKAAAEAKAIEEGRLKEVLESQRTELEILRKYKQAKADEEATLRSAALAKLSDDVRGIAEDLTTAKLLQFVDMQTTKSKTPPANAKGAAADGPEGSKEPLPGESPDAYIARMRKMGKVK